VGLRIRVRMLTAGIGAPEKLQVCPPEILAGEGHARGGEQ
jgi:hypothetical protein